MTRNYHDGTTEAGIGSVGRWNERRSGRHAGRRDAHACGDRAHKSLVAGRVTGTKFKAIQNSNSCHTRINQGQRSKADTTSYRGKSSSRSENDERRRYVHANLATPLEHRFTNREPQTRLWRVLATSSNFCEINGSPNTKITYTQLEYSLGCNQLCENMRLLL
jgi:hypothetical protein